MIPKINGTQTLTAGVFSLKEKICLCHGRKELFAVLENRLKTVPTLENTIFHFSSEDKVSSGEADNSTAETVVISLVEDTALAPEAYRLTISEEQAVVAASGDPGHIQGLTTLYQLLLEGNGSCPCQEIADAPLYGYRGFHMDCSRHFFDKETVLLMIELASRVKMNRLHWHISDDQGYRLESRRFPKLNSIGSWLTEPDGSRYGGYYTMEEVAEIVSYARARGIEIVPEIDMPGHVSAILAAYPELSCSGEPLEVSSMYGIHKRILCVGKEQTMDFVKELLAEVASLFPFPYFHIGGDEAPKDEWKTCESCQQKMKELGLTDEEDLQAHFTAEIADFLKTLGKTAICWNDSLKSTLIPADVICQYWDEEGENPAYCTKDAAFAERKWIYSFTPAFYFDYTPELTPMRKAYQFEPVLRSGTILSDDQLFGIECALWAERIMTRQDLLDRAFPRMFAVAERGWGSAGDLADFRNRCSTLLTYFTREGFQLLSVEDADPCGEHQKELVLKTWQPVIHQAKAAGMERFLPIVCGLIRSKLYDQFPPLELDALIKELQEG